MDKEDVVYLYAIEYSAITNKEMLTFVTTWMYLEGIMLSEMSQIPYNLIYEINKTKQTINSNSQKKGLGS